MKRVLLSAAIVVAAGAFLVLAGGAEERQPTRRAPTRSTSTTRSGWSPARTSRSPGVPAGHDQVDQPATGCVKGDTYDCYAQVTVQVTQNGFGQFRSDAFCQSRPQSLIGEYFIECEPGQNGKVIPPGGTIPVTHTQSTIPADLLQDVMQLPYRERFTLIVNELGAAVAGRSDDLQAALARAVPALTETDNLLGLLGNDSHTLQQLTANSELGDHRAGEQQGECPAVHHRGEQRRVRHRHAAVQPAGDVQQAAGASSSSSGRRWRSSARPPTRTRRCSPTSTTPRACSTACSPTCPAVLELGAAGDQVARPGLGRRAGRRRSRPRRRSPI